MINSKLNNPWLRRARVLGIASFVVITMLGAWHAWHARPPIVHFPPQQLPVPNAYDSYLAASKSIVLPGDIPNTYWHIRGLEGKAPNIYDRRGVAALVSYNHSALYKVRQGLGQACALPRIVIDEHTVEYGFGDLILLLELESYDRGWKGDWRGAVDTDLDGIQLTFAVYNDGWIATDLGYRGLGPLNWPEKLPEDFRHLPVPAKHQALARLERIESGRPPFSATLTERKWIGLRWKVKRLQDPQWSYATTLRNAGRDAIDLTPFPYPRELRRWTQAQFTSTQAVADNFARCYDRWIAFVQQSYVPTRAEPALPTDLINTGETEFIKRDWLDFLVDRAKHHLLLTQLAITTYRNEHGKYPNSLSQLVPDYLAALPEDPFAVHTSLKYQRKGQSYLLYSLGPDGNDDKGNPAIAELVWDWAAHKPLPVGDIVAGVVIQP